ncbi:MAG: cyclic nucleotide-binding domain-containing protein, partial [Clostridia bacterium]|nr:cyclic nucleotide-binding domain-containing protein [Clostridia bacterium]
MTEKDAFWHCTLARDLTDSEKEAAFLALDPRAVRYPQGAAVVRAGAPFAAVGLVAEGTLSVTRGGEHRRVIHKELGPAEIFGVSSLFGNGEGFPTTVTAKTEALVLFLDEAGVSRMLAAVPRAAVGY